MVLIKFSRNKCFHLQRSVFSFLEVCFMSLLLKANVRSIFLEIRSQPLAKGTPDALCREVGVTDLNRYY